jgi:dipeptidyl aminopeptidase/acylaminoacyl peptidase
VGERVCLRCDWTGETDGPACPKCGAALYRLAESTTPREVTPPPAQPQPAGDRIPGSPIEVARAESGPPARPVAASRRRGLIAGVFTVAAIWIATSVASSDRSEMSVAQGGDVAGPAETGPTGPPAPGVSETDYVIDLDTGLMRPLPRAIVRSLGGGPFNHQYVVSPGGSRLAYVGTRDARPKPILFAESRDYQIFIAGIDGTGVRQVTHAPNGASSPAWSPDGTRIAYEATDNRHRVGLYVLDVASGKSSQISGVNVVYGRCDVGLDPGCFEGDTSLYPVRGSLEPQFTPDGSSLIYTGGTNRHPVIWIVPVAGRESTLLIGPGWNMRDTENGSWSPDGSLVTFLVHQIGGTEVTMVGGQRWVADTDGTDRRLLPDVYGLGCRSTPAGTWSPDGSRIVCTEASKVIVIDIATGAATPVAAYGRGAIWLDDHTLLVTV